MDRKHAGARVATGSTPTIVCGWPSIEMLVPIASLGSRESHADSSCVGDDGDALAAGHGIACSERAPELRRNAPEIEEIARRAESWRCAKARRDR